MPVIESLLDKCDSVFIGGGMIFTFYKVQVIVVVTLMLIATTSMSVLETALGDDAS